ncbi:DUF1156 domain-containing protein [Pseudoxanthobacter sp. M-2]|uniref:DUF1156 domain-containing protein n=1 Tax=Pseudoxanthobacter sp. M-2 TaxID=3078754 RepID=UPI0038FC0C17
MSSIDTKFQRLFMTDPSPAPRKKLIEVSIPLEAINKASAREKSVRHGHPSTLHLWWARRPLAACRAVLFAQLVDDPSSWPEKFPTEAEQEVERRRLHRVIEEMVEWPGSKPGDAARFEQAIEAARWEIARSFAWGRGEEPPPKGESKAILAYLQEKAPPVYDPFSGGGSIPLEAQRLGLRAYGSDLNPVAVLIGKALVEIPPKFAGRPPVNPKSQAELKRGGRWNGKGAQGLAEDVRYYGQWMRDEAEKRIGHLYPKATLPDGSEATVIAWLWARTVRSPDPAAKGARVPLVSSFMLSTKHAEKAWVEVVIDKGSLDGWRFDVKCGAMEKNQIEIKNSGTKLGKGKSFTCILSGTSIDFNYIRSEAKEGGLKSRLMAIVAEGKKKRVYICPTDEHEAIAARARPTWAPDELITTPSHDVDRLPMYGMPRWRDAFTNRQLVSLATFSDLVLQAREEVLNNARVSGLFDIHSDHEGARSIANGLSAGGAGATAYADAVATYLGFAVDKAADRNTTLCSWEANMDRMRNTFGRQALPMVWDYSETNPLGGAGGDISGTALAVSEVLWRLQDTGESAIYQINASKNSFPVRPIIVSTDPPYYDNIGYAELSDFFYVWLKRPLAKMWPDLFRRLVTPKDEELVATPYRHGGKSQAEEFFLRGMGEALSAMRAAATDREPLAIYYAFKQSEAADDGVTSAGWASFLQAVTNAGLAVDGTWPLRTELANRMIGKGANALASSIVLVCRKRLQTAAAADRAGFTAALRRELPDAIAKIRVAGVGAR